MLTLLLAAQAATAEPATLWQNVRAGMTLFELRTARPAARPISATEKHEWFSGCEIADDKVSVEGVLLDVCYELRGGRISAVHMRSPLMNHKGAADRFKPALASKYGPPVLDVCGGFDRIFGHQTCNTVWKVGAVTIKNDRIKRADKSAIVLEFRAGALPHRP